MRSSGVKTISVAAFCEELERRGLNDDRLIGSAVEFVLLHQSEVKADDGGSQLEQHIFPVALTVTEFLQREGRVDPALISIALLHDVMEDDRAVTDNALRKMFGERVAEGVKLLTKEDWRLITGGSEGEKKARRDDEYNERLRSAPRDLLIVKLADRLNNVRRLSNSNPRKRAQYMEETKSHYLPLAKATSSFFYDGIVSELRKIEDTAKQDTYP